MKRFEVFTVMGKISPDFRRDHPEFGTWSLCRTVLPDSCIGPDFPASVFFRNFYEGHYGENGEYDNLFNFRVDRLVAPRILDVLKGFHDKETHIAVGIIGSYFIKRLICGIDWENLDNSGAFQFHIWNDESVLLEDEDEPTERGLLVCSICSFLSTVFPYLWAYGGHGPDPHSYYIVPAGNLDEFTASAMGPSGTEQIKHLISLSNVAVFPHDDGASAIGITIRKDYGDDLQSALEHA